MHTFFLPLKIYFKTHELEIWTRATQRNVDLEKSAGICKKYTLFLKNENATHQSGASFGKIWPVYFWAWSICVHAYQPQAGLLSVTERLWTCTPTAGQFTFGLETPAYMITGVKCPCTCPQAGLLSGAKHPCTLAVFLLSCTCPPAACWSTFGRARVHAGR